MYKALMKSARVAESSTTTRRISLPRDEATSSAQRNRSFKRMIDVPNETLNGFCDVDRSKDPHSFVRYLDKANSNDQVRFTKRDLLARVLHPQKGDHILDVGCGLGHDAHTLARLVGSTGHVVGVDRSKTMIDEALGRTRNLKLPLEFRIADVHHLDFHDKTFDACLVVSTFMHLENPEKALAEIVRVLQPGGRLVALEPDWDTLVMTTDNLGTSNAIVKIIRQSVCNSGIGHHLPGLFRRAGLKGITIEAGILMAPDYAIANDAWRIEASLERAPRAGICSQVRAQMFLQQLKLASKNGRFFGASTGFAVSGRKA